MHVSTLTLKVASEQGNHGLVHVLKRELGQLRAHVQDVQPLRLCERKRVRVETNIRIKQLFSC